MDKLSKIKLMIAEENTWQGIIMDKWPYSKIPPTITSHLKENKVMYTVVKLEENVWNYHSGFNDFESCHEMKKKLNCTSIFDPLSFKMPIRY